jgi:diaminopimelate epimerase
VDVVMPGGSAHVEIVEGDQPTVLLTGPAEYVATVSLDAEVREQA